MKRLEIHLVFSLIEVFNRNSKYIVVDILKGNIILYIKILLINYILLIQCRG